jgi:hypothetical protein
MGMGMGMGHSPFQMPIDVAVEEPRARIVSEESDRDVIVRVSDAHDIAFDGVDKVITLAAGTADDMEGVSVQVNRVLESSPSHPQPLASQPTTILAN